MVREVTVHLTEQRNHFTAQRFEQLRGDHTGSTVTAIDDHFELLRQRDIAGNFSRVARQNIDTLNAAFAPRQVVGLEAGV